MLLVLVLRIVISSTNDVSDIYCNQGIFGKSSGADCEVMSGVIFVPIRDFQSILE